MQYTVLKAKSVVGLIVTTAPEIVTWALLPPIVANVVEQVMSE